VPRVSDDSPLDDSPLIVPQLSPLLPRALRILVAAAECDDAHNRIGQLREGRAPAVVQPQQRHDEERRCDPSDLPADDGDGHATGDWTPPVSGSAGCHEPNGGDATNASYGGGPADDHFADPVWDSPCTMPQISSPPPAATHVLRKVGLSGFRYLAASFLSRGGTWRRPRGSR
jgi:hypothetical protein